jgi:hypothetical protein
VTIQDNAILTDTDAQRGILIIMGWTTGLKPTLTLPDLSAPLRDGVCTVMAILGQLSFIVPIVLLRAIEYH